MNIIDVMGALPAGGAGAGREGLHWRPNSSKHQNQPHTYVSSLRLVL
jgi:hypothetical protein